MEKVNKFYIGFVAGVVIPLVFVYVFVGLRYHGELNLWQLLVRLYELRGLTALIAVAALPNLILFYFFLNKEYWEGGKGIIAAVLVYAALVLLFYFSNLTT